MHKNKYIPSFGVEIHVELITNTKAFSDSRANYGDKPNSNINEIDLGYPGSKPLLNKKVVQHAYILAKALNMSQIEKVLYFDRKNYFYPDLAKGFQITQFYRPFAKNGYLEIELPDGNSKKIEIIQIHIEEDTAKQIRLPNGDIGFDYNRAGLPLIEIVSDFKQLHTPEEVTLFVSKLRQLLIDFGITKGDMHKGEFRVDVNVSVKPKDSSSYGERVEIKNINSFKFIKQALEYEIENHIEVLESNGKIEKVTKRFDENSKTNQIMRSKDSVTDYNYFPETNINPIDITKYISEFEHEYEKLKSNQGLENVCQVWLKDLISSKKISQDDEKHFLKACDFFSNEGKIKDGSIDFGDKSEIDIYLTIAKAIKNQTPNQYIKQYLKKEITEEQLLSLKSTSSDELESIIKEIIDSNPQIEQERYERKLKFISGELMKRTKGKANMKEASSIIEKLVNK